MSSSSPAPVPGICHLTGSRAGLAPQQSRFLMVWGNVRMGMAEPSAAGVPYIASVSHRGMEQMEQPMRDCCWSRSDTWVRMGLYKLLIQSLLLCFGVYRPLRVTNGSSESISSLPECVLPEAGQGCWLLLQMMHWGAKLQSHWGETHWINVSH